MGGRARIAREAEKTPSKSKVADAEKRTRERETPVQGPNEGRGGRWVTTIPRGWRRDESGRDNNLPSLKPKKNNDKEVLSQ